MAALLDSQNYDELESQASDHGLVMGHAAKLLSGDLFFRDGKRRIDYVLVYEDTEGVRLNKHDAWRQAFMANLRKVGLDMEEELVEGDHKAVHFIKLSAPWPVLVRYAEELCLRAPLQAHPNPSVNWSAGLLSALRIPNIMEAEVPNKPLDYYTCTFKKSKLDRYAAFIAEIGLERKN